MPYLPRGTTLTLTTSFAAADCSVGTGFSCTWGLSHCWAWVKLGGGGRGKGPEGEGAVNWVWREVGYLAEFEGAMGTVAPGLDPGEPATEGGVNLAVGWDGREEGGGTDARGSLRCCGAAHGAGAGVESNPGGLEDKLPLGFGVNLEGKGGVGSLGADEISTWAFGVNGFSREPVDPEGICKGKKQRTQQLSKNYKRKIYCLQE